MDKREIRLNLKQIKNKYSAEYKVNASKSVFKRLEETVIFKKSDNILLYYSLPDEINSIDFLQKWHIEKELYLPRVNGDNLDLIHYSQSNLAVGAYNIQEPQGRNCVPCDVLDLIVVPGVAFDRCGNRLGRGKGFYDRLLSKCKAIKVGVGYSDQLIQYIPIEDHDVPMDMVITDKEILIINNKG